MKKQRPLPRGIKDQAQYDELKAHLRSKAPLFGADSPFSDLLQNMVNDMLEGELDDHLRTELIEEESTNKRNGRSTKRVLSKAGTLDITTPRDRNGSFEPHLVGKRQRQLSSGLDEQILALYAQGNSIEDVRRLLRQIYGVEIAAGKISAITDQVLPRIQEWSQRELLSFYPIVYLDAIHFKVRHEGKYESRAFYTVYAVDFEGHRDILGMYVQGNEGATRWGVVLEDLKRRGVTDILVLCTDNLTGFSEVMAEVFPAAVVQKCIVHQVRNSLKFVDERERRKVAADLRKIYTAATLAQAQIALDTFAQKWGVKYGYIVKQWQTGWPELMAFLDFPPAMRRMIYTTNPVEALHRIIRKLVKSKAAWVSDTALIKQLFLSLMYNERSWRRKAYNWKVIQRQLLELYPERVKSSL